MRLKVLMITGMLVVTFLSSCGVLFGGRITACQTQRPAEGQPRRQIRPAALIADILFFGYGIPLLVDFYTGAIYKPCEGSNRKEYTPVVINSNNPISRIVSISPSSLVFPEFTELKYERTVNSLMSVVFNFQYWDRSGITMYSDDLKIDKNLNIRTIGVNFQTRFYLLNAYHAPEGLYFAPLVGVGSLYTKGTSVEHYWNSYTDESTDIKTEIVPNEAPYINTGLLLGYQWAIKKKFLIDLSIGSQRIYCSYKQQADLFSSNPWFPAMNVNFGYAF